MAAAQVRIAALCDHALVGQDGKLSMVGIFRNISVSGLPAQHPRMYIVAVLALEAGQHQVVVRLLRPDGTAVMEQAPRMAVSAVAGQDVNVIVELNNLNFTTAGDHRFDLEVDGVTIGTLPVTISHMTAAAPGTRPN
ncbi:MAG: hypothetical protein HYX69_09955 [Planctomycetia bacterium]|nr:hypothetical protein [Planctomycetia bacterium]